MQAFSTSASLPLLITGSNCRKSPQQIVKIPPKGLSLLQTSCSVRFTASKLSLLIIEHSSHTIILVCLNNSAVFEFLWKLQTWLSFTVRGILNLECAVLPPGIRVAAIPDDATATAIFPVLLTLARIVFSRKVFPVPPGASMNIKVCHCAS